jgi:hypothetical protein
MIDEVIDTAHDLLPPARISTGTCLRLGPAPKVKPRDRLIPPKKDLSLSQKTDRSRSLARLRLRVSSRRLPELLRSVASVSRHKSAPVKEGKNFFPPLSDTQEILSLLFFLEPFSKVVESFDFQESIGGSPPFPLLRLKPSDAPPFVMGLYQNPLKCRTKRKMLY